MKKSKRLYPKIQSGWGTSESRIICVSLQPRAAPGEISTAEIDR